AISGKSPRELLRDKNVAVVMVQAAIPPGAPRDATFDISIEALNATSLEGGVLWTTDLHLGAAAPFEGVQSRVVAKAKGPVFINLCATREKEGGTVRRRRGRVLEGGVVPTPRGIEVVLNNASHSRTRAIASAINSRFPEGPGDSGPVARGRAGPDLRSGG